MIADKPLAQYHPKVGDLWRSRHQEPDRQEFDSLPDWMTADPISHEDLADVQCLIQEAIESLTKREALVIRMRFWDELTLEGCAKILGVTQERARQIELKAIRKLRSPSIRLKLRDYSLWSEWYQWAHKNGSGADRLKALLWQRAQYPTNRYGYCISL